MDARRQNTQPSAYGRNDEPNFEARVRKREGYDCANKLLSGCPHVQPIIRSFSQHCTHRIVQCKTTPTDSRLPVNNRQYHNAAMVLAYKTPWRRAMFAETLSWTADPELSKQLATYADSAEVGKLRHFLLYCHQTDNDCVRRAISISTRDHEYYTAMAEHLKASTYIEYGDTVFQSKNVDSAMRVRYFISIRAPSAALGIPHEYVRLQILAYAGHRILWSSYRSTLHYRQSHFRMRGLAQKLWQDKTIIFLALGVPEGHELHRRLNELASRSFIYLEDVSGTVDSVCSGSLITEDRSPHHCLNSQGRAWDTKQAKVDEYVDQLGPVLVRSVKFMAAAHSHSLAAFERARQVRRLLRRLVEWRERSDERGADVLSIPDFGADQRRVCETFDAKSCSGSDLPPPYSERPSL
ncbi:hypothetical protein LTR95_014952 [Oleoguttula sp. CCFEE 5521]